MLDSEAAHAHQKRPAVFFSAEKHRQTHRDKKITEILESLLSHVEQKIMCEPVILSWMEGGEAWGGAMWRGGEQRGEGVRMKVGKGKDPFTTAQRASTRTPRKHPTVKKSDVWFQFLQIIMSKVSPLIFAVYTFEIILDLLSGINTIENLKPKAPFLSSTSIKAWSMFLGQRVLCKENK